MAKGRATTLLLGVLVLAAVGMRMTTADIPTNLADYYHLTLHDGYDVYWRFVVDDYSKFVNLIEKVKAMRPCLLTICHPWSSLPLLTRFPPPPSAVDLEFVLQAQMTTGWIGFGITNDFNIAMNGADLWVTFNDGGTYTTKDMKAFGQSVRCTLPPRP